jgi:hypothetical protein
MESACPPRCEVNHVLCERDAESAFLESLRIRLGRGRDEHGAAQSYVALAHVALKAGKLDDAERYATLALEAHTACGDQRGMTQAKGLLEALGR